MTVSNPRTGAVTTAVEQEIVITRVFDAPRVLVFKAWTDPDRVMRWCLDRLAGYLAEA